MEIDIWRLHVIRTHLHKIIRMELCCDFCEDNFADDKMAFHHYELSHTRMDVRCLKCNGVYSSVRELLCYCDDVSMPCPNCQHCSCICGPPSDDSFEYSDIFDENDFITKYMK